jgi:hypothetical protein
MDRALGPRGMRGAAEIACGLGQPLKGLAGIDHVPDRCDPETHFSLPDHAAWVNDRSRERR